MALHGSIVEFEDLLKGREDRETYAWFIENFGSLVVGQDKFKRSGIDAASKWMTVSSEACALLVYLNFFDRATDTAEKLSDDNNALRQGKLTVEGAKPAKHTAKGKGGSAKRNQGWNKDGIKKHNELFKFVTENRKEHPEFEEWFKNRRRQSEGTNKAAEKKRKREETRKDREEGWGTAMADDLSVGEVEEEAVGEQVAVPETIVAEVTNRTAV